MAGFFIRNNTQTTYGNTNEHAVNRRQERLQKNQNAQKRNGAIFMGNKNRAQDSIFMRKKQAMKRALKVVGDAWAGEKKLDKDVADRKARIQDSMKLMEENNEVIQGYEQRKEELRVTYGVAADSEEQKDLELLEKKNKAMQYPNEVKLSKQEEERLAQIEGQPLTEYQQRALSIDTSIGIYEKEAREAQDVISAESAALSAIKIERLKTHTMVDAQKEAEKIKEQAAKEAISALVGEAKDHIDETQKETIEEAKEKQEEKEEQEEKLEEAKEEKEVQEEKEAAKEKEKMEQEILENTVASGGDSLQNPSQAQLEIKEMLQKMKLLEEDIKGAKVDDFA